MGTLSDKTSNISINLPASKSISNRALIIQAICSNSIKLLNISAAEDTQIMLHNLSDNSTKKDVGMAGTAARFLTAFYALKKQKTHITAHPRMQERPMRELCLALENLGAKFQYLDKKYHLPFIVDGTNTTGGNLEIDATISSQFTTALMLIAPALKNGLTITLKGKTTSESYILMTKNIMEHFGVKVKYKENKIEIKEQDYHPNSLVIENDWSSASYFYSAFALMKNGRLTLKNLSPNSWQGDKIVAEIYYRLGVKTIVNGNDLVLEHSEHKIDYLNYDFSDCPDLAQTVICTCTSLGIQGNFKGLHTLKNKETDRIKALQNELKKLRWLLIENKDHSYTLRRALPTETYNPKINTYNDHRMAMAFAPLKLLHPKLEIENPEVVKKSFPNFWLEMEKIGIFAS
ncbi:MAG: hypothetical protein R2777_01990 [Chitinophagales bacterium]